MTNNQIIYNESLQLVEAGILKYTGRFWWYVDDAGERHEIPEIEPIHTFAAWKAAGYIVKKGEKAIASFPIWKHTKARTVRDKEGNETEKPARMFLKTSYFFTFDQVERMTAKA